MANLPENSTFDAGVFALQTTDLVLGGLGGPANAGAQNLANRTRWLFDQNTLNVAALATHGAHLTTIDGEITTIFGSIASINANLASINGQLPLLASIANPTLTGVPKAPTAAAGANSTQIATTAFVANSFAPLASPALTGAPTAPTQALNDSTTKLATTAFVNPGSSIGATGYRKNPDGTIEQWGSYNVVSGLSVPVDIGISFPFTFPHAVFDVSPTADRRVGAAGQAADGSNFSSQKTTSGATLTVDNNGTGSFVGTWRAVGW